jgi:hypothetical protein
VPIFFEQQLAEALPVRNIGEIGGATQAAQIAELLLAVGIGDAGKVEEVFENARVRGGKALRVSSATRPTTGLNELCQAAPIAIDRAAPAFRR